MSEGVEFTYKYECPACFYEEKEVTSEEYVVSEVLTCLDCGVDLEVKNIKKKGLERILEVELAEMVEEDWGE